MMKFKFQQINSMICIIAVFVISRIIFFYKGIHFYTGSLWFYRQYIDISLLKNNLIQSVYFLHHQPPLFNLFLGIILKLFPNNYQIAFYAVYLLMGLIFSISLYLIMCRLGVLNKLSAALTIIFMVSPSVIAYENFLFYEYPLAVILCAAALFLHRYLEKEKLSDAIIFFVLLAGMALTRSLYHISWFLVFVFILIFYKKHNWGKIIIASAIPFTILLFVCLKNLLIFGVATTTTLIGPEFAQMTTFQMLPNERMLLAEQGKISKLSLVYPYSPVESYEKFFPVTKTNISVLDQRLKSTGSGNYNNIIYVPVSKQYFKDAIYVFTRYPEYFLKALKNSFFIYLIPGPSKGRAEGENAEMMKLVSYFEKFYNIIFLGRILPHTEQWTYQFGDPLYEARMGLFWLIGFPFLLVYFLVQIILGLRSKSKSYDSLITIIFMWTTIIYITILSVLGVRGCNRYRFPIESFVFILLGLFLSQVFNKFSKNKAGKQ